MDGVLRFISLCPSQEVESPLDNVPVWRYVAKDALSSPSVPAVAQFQKVTEQTEKELAQKQQKKP
jgi:hypothetical protein